MKKLNKQPEVEKALKNPTAYNFLTFKKWIKENPNELNKSFTLNAFNSSLYKEETEEPASVEDLVKKFFSEENLTNLLKYTMSLNEQKEKKEDVSLGVWWLKNGIEEERVIKGYLFLLKSDYKPTQEFNYAGVSYLGDLHFLLAHSHYVDTVKVGIIREVIPNLINWHLKNDDRDSLKKIYDSLEHIYAQKKGKKQFGFGPLMIETKKQIWEEFKAPIAVLVEAEEIKAQNKNTTKNKVTTL